MIPNLSIAVPKDVNEFRSMLEFSATFDKPLAIRYPREGTHSFKLQSEIILGKWEMLSENENASASILACGERAVTAALEASQLLEKENIKVNVINSRFVKPLDTKMLKALTQNLIITVEDNVLSGGFGSHTHFSSDNKKIKNFAFPDKFIPHGSVTELMKEFGITGEAIAGYILNAIR